MRWLLALVMCATLRAERWTATDYALEALSVVSIAADWGQTLDIERRGQYETNRWLGPHPTRRSVNLYFSGLVLSHLLISKLLPPAARRVFQCMTLVVEGSFVKKNASFGLSTKF